MKKINLTIIILVLSIFQISAQESCINAENLKKLDALWEKSLMVTNLEFFESTVSKDFIWVHGDGIRTDSKLTLLELVQRIHNGKPDYWKSRIQKDIKVIISGTTGVVNGYTVVEKYDGSQVTFNFMRTYSEIDGICILLANHTILLSEKEED